MLISALPWSLCFVLLVRAFNVTPRYVLSCRLDSVLKYYRWGQAVALLNSSLFIHGGKTDQFNSYSYTSAPNTNDLLYLPLTSSFSAASPPWILVSNSTNSSSPFLAWHTLSPSNLPNVLLFGGIPDPNSPTVVVVSLADSAEILNVASPLQPSWSPKTTSWAGEPVRRVRHSTATSSSSQVFIIGGEMADGSGIALSDHYVFNPTVPSFTLLPPNGPPDIYGHASIILSDGRLLVFGGYSPSQGTLLPFSTIWVLDTSQSNLAWSVIQTSTASLPSPRIAFAATSLNDGGVLIHGGSDEDLQTNFADGWILNTSQTTMGWTQVEALSQLGALRDHFAATQGDLVILGFGKLYKNTSKFNVNKNNKGYDNNGPAPAALQIYNSSSQSFVSLFEPLPPTQTTPTQTGKSHTSPTSRPPSSTSGPTTTDPNNPSSDANFSSSRNRTVAISASLGAFAFLVILSGTAYYLRRRQHGQGVRFMALGGDDRGDRADSPHFDGEIPAVSTRGDHDGGNRGLLSSLGFVGAISAVTKMKNARNAYQRRDMLADEDTRSFGEWYASRGGDGTGGSSWSLKNILGGGARLASREASIGSHGTNTGGRNTPWREKSVLADGTSLLHDEGTGLMEVATTSGPTRPLANGRLMSQASWKSGLSYKDPFSNDPIQEEEHASNPFSGEEEIENPLRFSVRHVPALPSIMAIPPLSQHNHAPSSLSEHTHTFHHTSTIPEYSTATSSYSHSSETGITPFGGSSSLTSRTSVDPIIGTVYNDMRRTNSWWTRFTRTSLLDRRLSDASRKSVTSGKFEIRDPKPPPRLDAIAENVRLGSSSEEPSPRQQQGPTLSRGGSMVYETGHKRSMSSLRTADSEAIEWMAGTMDVIQRFKTRSSSYRTTASRSSAGGFSVDTLGSSVNTGHNNYVRRDGTSQGNFPDDLLMISSPALQAPGDPPPLSTPSPSREVSIRPIASSPLLLKSTSPPMSPTSPSIADRIHAFEKLMLREQTSSPSPPPPPDMNHEERSKKKRVTVDYGLVPRASLFVANPDDSSHRLSTFGRS